MEDFDGVRDEGGLGGGVDDSEAAVVLEGGADDEAFSAAVVPRASVAGLGVDDDRRAEGGNGRCVKVEGAVEVLLGVHGRGNV